MLIKNTASLFDEAVKNCIVFINYQIDVADTNSPLKIRYLLACNGNLPTHREIAIHTKLPGMAITNSLKATNFILNQSHYFSLNISYTKHKIIIKHSIGYTYFA